MSNLKYNISFWLLITVLTFLFIDQVKAHEKVPPPHEHQDYRLFVGFGTGNSEGSGIVGLSNVVKDGKYSTFVDFWTDSNNHGTQFVVQERRTPKQTRILVVQGDTEGSANICTGGMRNWYTGKFRLGAGLAYCVEDNGPNIREHFQILGKLMYQLPKNPIANECGGIHYARSETFVGCSRRF